MFRQILKTGLTGLLIVISSVGPAMAEKSILWGNLDNGPYGVGYKTIEQFDHSRVMRAKTDYFGQILPGERARPIQACIWYPAIVNTDDYHMTLGEYSYTYPEDEQFIRYLSGINNREIGYWQRTLGVDNGFVLDLFSISTEGVLNAAPVEGTFPLLIYFPHLEGNLNENVVMCEYLASHGFVVASTHPAGTYRLGTEMSAADLEASIRDKEFVWSMLRKDSLIDNNKCGVFGFATGGTGALLMQLRNSDIDAVAGFGGSYTYSALVELIKNSPNFDCLRGLKPIMQFYSDFGEEPHMDVISQLEFAPIFSYYAENLDFGDCTITNAIRALVPDSMGNTRSTVNKTYEMICNYTANFFKAVLNDDDKALQFLNNDAAANNLEPGMCVGKYSTGKEIPPTRDQFISILQAGNVRTAYELHEKFRSEFPDWVFFDEATMNAYGYRNLQTGRIQDALILFKMNSESFPNSANCWDSYADGLIAAGDTLTAASCYKKVMSILEGDHDTDPGLVETLRANAENFLSRSKESEN